MSKLKSCEYCGEAAEQSCGGCSVAAYCTREHQKLDWKKHKGDCRTFKMIKDGRKGRYLVAARKIKAGELVFAEDPIALGPRAVSSLICLGCHNAVTEEDFIRCSTCNWPMCSPLCSDAPQHKRECEVLKLDIKKCGVPQKLGETPRYDLILVLRCLLLRSYCPSAWRKLQMMESHLENRKEEKEAHHVATVRYLTEVVNVDFEENEVHRARGVIITNSYETRGSTGVSLRGIYPLLALVNHSCVPNLAIRADKSCKMYIKAATDINEGQMLTVSYTGVTSPVWERATCTSEIHYFTCDCERCLSPTELDTYFSSPTCSSCYKCPLNYNNEKDLWQCLKCGLIVPGNEVVEISQSVASYVNSDLAFETKTCESILKTLKGVEKKFHKKHYVWVLAAQNAIRLLSKFDTNIEALRLKRDLWEELLAIYDILEPGMTRRRAVTLMELVVSDFAVVEKETAAGQMTSEIFQRHLQKDLTRLNEAEDILNLEPPDSLELKWLQKAIAARKQVESVLST